ncbi:itaconate degradation C-C-lyase RipC [Azospirillum agricola]|uniref:itaconate degradation C-C-lyase RipC n=1 Tax=Azospirillum agricola TaxID=1720247 RepID=UPI000A0F32A2|nr:itaconate degradation C-C-lyase RipC [Azospirillum agricola]SMH29988.1 (S)-citramalyl-CoA lyase [Azospirillum lipoferum]
MSAVTTAPVPRRSWLFTPATRPERFARAAEAGADVLIIDLEDAVAPVDKAAARRLALEALATAPARPIQRALRVNAPVTLDGLEDLLALARSPVRPDVLILPKTESAEMVRWIDALLSGAGCPLPLVALIESARGVAAVEAIAQASPRLTALFFGAADLSADLGCATAWEPLLAARSRLVNAAALAGIEAVDSPFFALNDAEGLARETQAALALGFGAKAAIHPGQVAAINAALTPNAEAVAQARRILVESAKGVGVVDGRMIDEAVARKARRILARAGDAAAGDPGKI